MSPLPSPRGRLLGAVAYFELIGIATKHLSPTLVGASVALEPLCVSALGVAFFGYSLNRVEAGGYVCASVGAASLAGAYSCEGRARAALGAALRRAAFRRGGGAPEKGSYRMVALDAMSPAWRHEVTNGALHSSDDGSDLDQEAPRSPGTRG